MKTNLSASKIAQRIVFSGIALLVLASGPSSAIGTGGFLGSDGVAVQQCEDGETTGPVGDDFFFAGDGCAGAWTLADAATLAAAQIVVYYKTTGYVGEICGSFEVSGVYVGSSGLNCFANDQDIVATFPASINTQAPIAVLGDELIVTWHPTVPWANAYVHAIAGVGIA